MFRYSIGALVLAGVFIFGASAQDKETPDDSFPRVLAVTVRADGVKECQQLEGVVARVRGQVAEKNVLFVGADTTSRATRHQSKLLLNALGLGSVWRTHCKTNGKLLLVDVTTGEVLKTLPATTTEKDLIAALAKVLVDDDADTGDDDSDMDMPEEEDDDGGDGDEELEPSDDEE